MTTRPCTICHALFAVESCSRHAVTCRNPECVRARAKQRRAAFEARKKHRQDEARAAHAARREAAQVLLAARIMSPPRPVRLPDGTCAEVIWAGDMVVSTGVRGGLLGHY